MAVGFWGRATAFCLPPRAALVDAAPPGAGRASAVSSVPWLRGNAPGAEGGLGPVGGLELVEDARDVVLHGLQGDAEGAGDLLVAGTFGQQVEYFTFSRGQVVWPGWGGRAGQPPGSLGQEPAGDS